MGHPSHPEVLACGLPAPEAEALPPARLPADGTPPPATSSVPHVGSTLGLPTQVFSLPLDKSCHWFKKRERERKRDEVSQGPEPSLVLEYLTWGGAEAVEREREGEKKEEQRETKCETEREGRAACCTF